MPESDLTAEEYEQLLRARADHAGRVSVREAIGILHAHAEAARAGGSA